MSETMSYEWTNPFPGDEGFDNSTEAGIETPGDTRDETYEGSIDDKLGSDDTTQEEMERIKRDVYDKVGLNLDDVDKKEGDIKNLVDRVQHLTLRLLKPTDIESMTDKQRERYEKQMARKVRVYDFLKNYTGVNLYQISAKRKLNEAKTLKGKLESNLRTFEQDLRGSEYRTDMDKFNQNLKENLPQYIREDKQFTDFMNELENGGKTSRNRQGLKAMYQEVGEKGRALTDFDDLLNVWVSDYQKKIDDIQEEISGINENLSEDVGNKDLIQKRMNLNSQYNLYQREKDKLLDKQKHTVQELSVLGMKYKGIEAQIALKESTINTTRKTIQRLNVGIEQFENYIQTEKDFVVIGGHMTEVDYARGVADIINAGSAVAGYATYELIKEMANDIGRNDDVSAFGGNSFKDLNTDIMEQQRTDAERAKAVFR